MYMYIHRHIYTHTPLRGQHTKIRTLTRDMSKEHVSQHRTALQHKPMVIIPKQGAQELSTNLSM